MDSRAVAYELDGRATEFIWRQLGKGGSLSRRLRDRFGGHLGLVTTWLPQGMAPNDLYDFDGEVLPKTKSTQHPLVLTPDGTVWRATLKRNMDGALADILRAHLLQGNERICLFEDNGINADLLKREQTDVRTCVSGREVYRLLTGSDAEDAELITETIRTARSWLFLGALTSLAHAPSPSLSSIGVLNPEQIDAAADDATEIIVGCYDYEGFLVWRPD